MRFARPAAASTVATSTVAALFTAALLLTVPAAVAFAQNPDTPARPRPLTPVPFHRVTITGAFWKKKIQINRTATVEACLKKCEETGRLENFAVAAGLNEGKHQGILFNDSDVYKVIEGIAYTLKTHPDPGLQKRTEAIIDWIEAAQGKDGYLNTWVQLVHPEKRWVNIQNGHELYCAGHLIEAGIAWFQTTGQRKLLDVGIRFADLIGREFGPGKRMDPPGHQELELALVKLHRVTGEKRYLELARFFLDRRGRPEGRARLFGKYYQDHLPVREQSEVEGHAVRAMYLFCAMAGVAAATGDRGLLAALDRLWHDVVQRKMYVTGGIGDSASNEGFTGPYILPNETAYAETCAAIGMVLWNHRMFLMTGEGRYLDVLERVVLNGLLSGVSRSGDRFFYPNRLGSRGGQTRVPWFHCSCCPVNVVRTIPAIGEWIYAQRGRDVYVGLYVDSSTEIELAGGIRARLMLVTAYPWSNSVLVTVRLPEPAPVRLHLRRPGWLAKEARIQVNGKRIEPRQEHGFYVIELDQAQNRCEIEFPMPVRRVYADPRVKADQGRVAIMRGPVVYCLEGVDHGGHARNIVLPRDVDVDAFQVNPAFFSGCAIDGRARVLRRVDGKRVLEPIDIRLIPYHAWANRDAGEMVVWIPETPDLAEFPGEGRTVRQRDVTLHASHCWEHDTLTALNDGRLPTSSGDHGVARMTWWPRCGSTEWVQYTFDQPRTVGRASVYWFDDTGRGRCRVPRSWRLLYLDDRKWRPVTPAEGQHPGTARDTFNTVTFAPVTTRAVRLEATLQPDLSGGVLEWRVESRE